MRVSREADLVTLPAAIGSDSGWLAPSADVCLDPFLSDRSGSGTGLMFIGFGLNTISHLPFLFPPLVGFMNDVGLSGLSFSPTSG